jgi:hypothetical protein
VAITFPLTLLSSPGFTDAVFSAQSVVAATISPFTFDQQLQKHPGQRWGIQASLPPMQRADAENWISFLLKLNGIEGTFLIGDPGGRIPRGIATGTPLVNGASQTGNSINTDGWTASQTGILKAGDYVQFGTGDTARLHKVLNDADSDVAGNATFDIWPSLRESPVDNSSIIIQNTVGMFRMSSNNMSWSIDTALIYGLSFEAVEVL